MVINNVGRGVVERIQKTNEVHAEFCSKEKEKNDENDGLCGDDGKKV